MCLPYNSTVLGVLVLLHSCVQVFIRWICDIYFLHTAILLLLHYPFSTVGSAPLSWLIWSSSKVIPLSGSTQIHKASSLLSCTVVAHFVITSAVVFLLVFWPHVASQESFAPFWKLLSSPHLSWCSALPLRACRHMLWSSSNCSSVFLWGCRVCRQADS